MKLDKLSLDGKKNTIEVLDKVFSGKIYKKLVNSVLYKTNANYKGRKAKTKQKNEIIGSTSKIYAQKGTGGARHASRKAPIFVGGGGCATVERLGLHQYYLDKTRHVVLCKFRSSRAPEGLVLG